MKRVEFFGIPGVGKSTLVTALERHAVQQSLSHLVFYSDLDKHIQALALTSPLTALSTDTRSAAENKRLLASQIQRYRREAVRKQGPAWDDFLDIVLDSYRGAMASKHNKLGRLRWTLATIEACAVIDHIPRDELMLFDVSLCQGGLSLALCLSTTPNEMADAALARYYSYMPPPGAVIILTAPPAVIHERLIRRAANSLTRGQRARDIPITMHALECGIRILNQQNVPVLILDATEGVVDNMTKIKSFLGEASDTQRPVDKESLNGPVLAGGSKLPGGAPEVDGLHATRASYHDEKANTYDTKRESTEKWEIEQRLFHTFFSECKHSDTILDVPVGTGRFLPMYESFGLRATGVDLSTDMLKVAAQKLSREGDQIQLSQGDILAGLRFGDKTFDIVVCVRLMNWMSEVELAQCIAELARLCRTTMVFTLRYANDPVHSGRNRGGLYIHKRDAVLNALHTADFAIEDERVIQPAKSSTYKMFVAAPSLGRRSTSIEGGTGA